MGKIRNTNVEIRNKFKYKMAKAQKAKRSAQCHSEHAVVASLKTLNCGAYQGIPTTQRRNRLSVQSGTARRGEGHR